MAVPPDILNLVERFNRNRESCRSVQYKEHQLRIEFIDPFFKSLGWDVANESGYAESIVPPRNPPYHPGSVTGGRNAGRNRE